MKKVFYSINLILFLFIAVSCSDNTSEPDAIPMTIEQIAGTPGYFWIWDVLSNYQADSTIMQQIQPLLDTNRDKFVFFTRASCSCPSEQKDFAYIVKILRDFNFPQAKYELFAMSSRNNPNPYSNVVKLNELPQVIYFRDGVPYYSLIDTLQYNINHLITYPIKPEELLLEALKKP